MAFKCLQCLNCCRRYWITALPEEVLQQARMLKQTKKDFLDSHCQLFLQIFPAAYLDSSLTVFKSLVPRRIEEKLSEKAIALPDNFLVLPCIAFKRENNACVFLEKKSKLCRIHKVKPMQCALFPFINLLDKDVPYPELYPFCQGLKKGSAGRLEKFFEVKQERYFALVKDYFNKVKLVGFKKLWHSYPKKGKLFFKGTPICDLSEKEFFQIISPFE